MKVDLMRWIDYWAGVPMCFLLSVSYKLMRLVGINKPRYNKPLRKALFIELSEMGSPILAYSAMRRLKDLAPGCQLYFLIFNENKESVSLLNTIPEKNIITIRSKSFLKLKIDTIKALHRIRKLRFDAVFDLELFSRYTSILTALSGSNFKIGFYRHTMEGLYRGDFLTHKVSYNPYMHMSKNFLSLIYSLKSPKQEMPMTKRRIEDRDILVPIRKSSSKAIALIWKKLQEINPNISNKKKIVILNPNSSQLIPIRKWPIQNYIQLARRLLKNKDIFIIITGVKREKKDAKIICEAVSSDRCIDFTGKTTLSELVDLYNIVDFMITNDSGPAHFSTLANLKTFVIMGPETPNLYAPIHPNAVPIYSNFSCSPCVSAFNHRKTRCKNNKCLQAITVDQVYNLIKK